jgi:hypothetical protein
MAAQAVGTVIRAPKLYGLGIRASEVVEHVGEPIDLCPYRAGEPISDMTGVALFFPDVIDPLVDRGQADTVRIIEVIHIRPHDRMAGAAEGDFLGSFKGHKVPQEEEKDGNDAQAQQMKPPCRLAERSPPVIYEDIEDDAKGQDAETKAKDFCELKA